MIDNYEKYDTAVRYIIEKYRFKEISKFIKKNSKFEKTVARDKDFLESKGMAQYRPLDAVLLEGYKSTAVMQHGKCLHDLGR